MWESCANKQLHCPINVIFQSDVPVPKLLWLRQLSIPAQSPDCHVRAAAKLLLNSSSTVVPEVGGPGLRIPAIVITGQSEATRVLDYVPR